MTTPGGEGELALVKRKENRLRELLFLVSRKPRKIEKRAIILFSPAIFLILCRGYIRSWDIVYFISQEGSMVLTRDS